MAFDLLPFGLNPKFPPHEFEGRVDQACRRCGWPDRGPDDSFRMHTPIATRTTNNLACARCFGRFGRFWRPFGRRVARVHEDPLDCLQQIVEDGGR